MHFIIFTGGVLKNGRAVDKTLQSFDKVIAVDSGASYCHMFKLIPDFLVGDFDSIDNVLLKKFAQKGSRIFRFPEEKDVTDTEIGIKTAIKNGATKITVLGGINGDRIDHILANVLLTVKYIVPIYYIDAETMLWLAKGPTLEKIKGKKGDLLSLIPLSSTASAMQTKGLKYALKNDKLFFGKTRGISNVLTADTAEVKFSKGALLLIHTLLA